MEISLLLATFFLWTILAASAQIGSRAAIPVASGKSTALPGNTDSVSAGLSGPGPDLQILITGLETAQHVNRAHMVPFTVTREYELFRGENREAMGTVVVEVHFQPPATKTWIIKKTSGSGRAETVVKNVLEREVNWARDSRSAIGRQNYDFQFVGSGETDRRPCYILELIPKRADSDLLRGRIWVDRDTYLIHRFEGTPAKNPSWWLKDVKISSSYGELGGIWLPTNSKGLADVRLIGPHTMTERTLSYRAGRTVVEGPAADMMRLARAQNSSSYRPSATVGVSIIGPR